MASPYDDDYETWEGCYDCTNLDCSQEDISHYLIHCATWISDESRKIAAFFRQLPKSSQPILSWLPKDQSPRFWCNGDDNFDAEAPIVRPLHKRPRHTKKSRDIISDSPTFVDLVFFQGPISRPGPSSSAENMDYILEPQDENGGDQQNTNSDNEDDTTTTPEGHQPWRINETGDLIISEPFTTELAAIAVLTPSDLQLQSARHEAISQLWTEDRHLEALRKALQFTLADMLDQTYQADISAEVGSHENSPYPVIHIHMPHWRPDTELQCCLAYYILRGMLKLYRSLPFPDRLDIYEFGFDQSRLLAPFGAEAIGEPARVRRRIIEELEIEMSLMRFGTPEFQSSFELSLDFEMPDIEMSLGAW